MGLKVISFNCNSIRKNDEIVYSLLNKCDILLVQETLLTADSYDFVSKFHLDFVSYHVPAIDPCIDGLNGRPRGGLSIFWNKKLEMYVTPEVYNENIMGLKIQSNDCHYLMLNVYMPYEDRKIESLAKYRNLCAQIQVIAENENINKVIIAGDFNADPNRGRYWYEIIDLVDTLKLEFADLNLPIDSYTYLSPAHGSTSWLDHVLSSPDLITNVKILYGETISDHVPLLFNCTIPIEINNLNSYNENIEINDFVIWEKLTKNEIFTYQNLIQLKLNLFYNEGFSCRDSDCTLIDHYNDLSKAYNYLIETLKECSKPFTVKCKQHKFKSIPGWSDECKQLYASAKVDYFVWNSTGRLRIGQVYEQMKSSKREFKKALDKCKKNEIDIRNSKIAASFSNKNKKEFWSTVKKLNAKVGNSINKIDGESDPTSILNIFENKYKNIFVDDRCKSIPDDFTHNVNRMKEAAKKSNFRIVNDMIVKAINSLNPCIGLDGLHSNHYKLGGNSLVSFLSKLFSSCLAHGFMPEQMLRGEVRPTVKDKFGKVNDSNNYRPITISSNSLKIFEYSILNHLEGSLTLNHRQFGFRRFTSTSMATLILKETIRSYMFKNSKVYAAFIDLSKAFDKVNHKILVNKLCKSSLSPVIVNIIKEMYSKQKVYVKFQDNIGDFWLLENGVRQGGILSPLLFSFYINDILDKVSNLRIGCRLDRIVHNIQAYADDLVLLAPSVKGLQFLIDSFCTSLSKTDLIINTDKSVCMIFKRRKNAEVMPTFYLNGKLLTLVSSYKYLGIELFTHLTNKKDVVRVEKAFLRQFYSIFRKFSSVDRDILIFLFKSYCMSFYACELWDSLKYCSSEFKSLCVNYHLAVKMIVKKKWFHSNHAACEEAGLPIFKHFLNSKLISFAFNLKTAKSRCLSPYKCFIINESYFINRIKNIFRQDYQIENVLNNDLDAIKSRIVFIERREPRSSFTF